MTNPDTARPLRVLAVDDDKVDRIALQRALARTSMTLDVVEATGVLAAIEMLAATTFDCVILDYSLPDGDGLTFLRGLRAAGLTTPVIMLTGQEEMATMVELLSAGAADYIPKGDLSPAQLEASLRRAIGAVEHG